MKKIKSFTAIAGFALVLGGIIFAASPASALPIDDARNIATNQGLARYQTFEEIAKVALTALMSVAFIITLIFMVLAGYRMVASRGNEEAVTAARKNLLWAIIGIAVIALSWAIMQLVLRLVVTGRAV